jgi:hypothetical protein
MAQPRDSKGRFASNGTAGVAVVALIGAGLVVQGGGAGAGAGSLTVRSVVRAPRSASVGGTRVTFSDRSLRPARVRGGRLRLRVPLELLNQGGKPLVVDGEHQVLVTDDGERYEAEDIEATVRPGSRRRVVLTFTLTADDVPAELVLRWGGRSRTVALRTT